MKEEKMLHGTTKVDKLNVSKQITGRRDHTEAQSRHSHVKSQLTGELEFLAADSDLSQTLSSHSINSSKQLTVKPKSSFNEKVSKKDAADIVIRQLTPYYKTNRFGSKVC